MTDEEVRLMQYAAVHAELATLKRIIARLRTAGRRIESTILALVDEDAIPPRHQDFVAADLLDLMEALAYDGRE